MGLQAVPRQRPGAMATAAAFPACSASLNSQQSLVLVTSKLWMLMASHACCAVSCCAAEKLRVVFEALLANPASRTLMRGLLKGAGMPFNEEAFEEQVKVRGGAAERFQKCYC
jgi:hypothetical protein